MKPETFLVDIGENEGLRVNKGKTGLTSFSYRFRSPIDNSLKKVKLVFTQICHWLKLD